MDFRFTDDQELFRDAVRALLADRCSPDVVRAAWDGPSGHQPALWAALAEMGVIGLTAPESTGGLGLNEIDLVLLLEEAGRAALPEPLLEHTAVAVPLLRDVGGAIADDCLTEAATGERILTVKLEAASFVNAADRAHGFVLERAGEIHLVSRDAVNMQPVRSVDGSRRLAAVEWTARPETLLARGSHAAAAAASAFDRGAAGSAAQLIGLGRQMLDVTVSYVGQREQFGKPVGSYQAVKHHLANARVALDFASALTYSAAHAVATTSPDRAQSVSGAKLLASEATELAGRVALQCHGAIGYTVEHDLHLWLKRAWALAAAWGDAGWHRRRIATTLAL